MILPHTIPLSVPRPPFSLHSNILPLSITPKNHFFNTFFLNARVIFYTYFAAFPTADIWHGFCLSIKHPFRSSSPCLSPLYLIQTRKTSSLPPHFTSSLPVPPFAPFPQHKFCTIARFDIRFISLCFVSKTICFFFLLTFLYHFNFAILLSDKAKNCNKLLGE